jgi:hypothetical protein
VSSGQKKQVASGQKKTVNCEKTVDKIFGTNIISLTTDH